MSMVAMGISQKYEDGLPALPAVAGELNHVVKDPKVQGADGVCRERFCWTASLPRRRMENQLTGSIPWSILPATLSSSRETTATVYLLLCGQGRRRRGISSDGGRLSRQPEPDPGHTDLLTLSACETGMSGSAGNGREVDGLGTTAQLKGAKAVISSLWSVNDASTGQLMGDFYKRWAEGGGNVTKVEALRKAQLDLLLGQVKPAIGAGDRGSDMETAAQRRRGRGLCASVLLGAFCLDGQLEIALILFATPATAQCARLAAPERTQQPTRRRRAANPRPRRPPGSSGVVPNSRDSIHLLNAKEPSVPSATPARARPQRPCENPSPHQPRSSLPTPCVYQFLWCADSPNRKSTRKSRAMPATVRIPQILTAA